VEEEDKGSIPGKGPPREEEQVSGRILGNPTRVQDRNQVCRRKPLALAGEVPWAP
jgi:hypothetical protein